MTATFANPKETDVPIVFDSNSSNGLGFATQGIGLRGADHASVGASRIGGAPGTDLKYDTDRNPAA
jgi:hypothetical protein